MDFSKLSKTIDSIDKLKEFINVSTSIDEKLEASFYIAKIYYELKMYDDAIKTIVKNINDEVKKNNNKYYHMLLDYLIFIYTDTYNLNDAIKWINKKKENLAVLDIYKADILLLEVYKKSNEEIKALSLAKSLLNEQIDVLEKTEILKYLVKYYLKLEKYDDALVYIRKLKENTYELDNYNYYYAIYFESYCSYKIGEYKTALVLNNECLDNMMFITEELLTKSYILDLMITIALGDYKKAILKESEYESTVLESTYEDKFDFYNACIDLYTKDFNKPSLELYKERLEKLEKPVEDDLVINHRIDLKPVKIKEEVKEEKKTDDYKENKNTIYSIINQMNEISQSVLLKGIKPKVRDNLLSILDKLNELVKFEVCVIVNINRSFSGYYYKKNRLYERDYKDMKNTVVYECVKHKNEQIFPNRDSLYGKRDIYLDTLYENTDIDCVIAFPIIIDDEVTSVIYFYSFDNSLYSGYNYELLKFASSFMADRMINRIVKENSESENSSYLNAFLNVDIPIKYMVNDNVLLNNKARELLNQKPKLKLNEYMIGISADDYKAYREFLNSDIEEFSYRYNDLDILEKKKKIGNEIISILSNNSLFKNLERKENELIYLDSDTRTKNMYSLKKDLKDFIVKEKFTIIELNIKTYAKIYECYGAEYSNRVIRNTAMYLKEFLNTDNIYHFYKDVFYCILDGINDSRTVEKKCLELIDYLRLNVNKNTSRIEARYSIGALRYKSQTLIKDIELILDYVGFALKTAQQSVNSFAYFDMDLYKEAFNDTSLVANINEAIDYNKIGVSYNQVIDLNNMVTAFYRINPIIPSLNVSYKEIYDVIALRGLSFKLEILMIRKSISEILKIYDKEKKYVRISVNVSYDTILHKEFISFMKRLVVDNKLPKGLIIFNLINKRKVITKEVEQLSNMGIRFMSGYIEDCMLINVNYFRVSYLLPHLGSEKGKLVLESLKQMSEPLNMKLIIDGIEKEEIPFLKQHEIDLVSYGKELLIDDILKRIEG